MGMVLKRIGEVVLSLLSPLIYQTEDLKNANSGNSNQHGKTLN